MSSFKRIATITLPILDNNKHSTELAHKYLTIKLLELWGGYSVAHSTGFWRDPATGIVYEDFNRVYSVAMETDLFTRDRFSELAHEVGQMAHQLAVALTHANGDFVIMDIAPQH